MTRAALVTSVLAAACAAATASAEAAGNVMDIHVEYLDRSEPWCPATEGAQMSVEIDGPRMGESEVGGKPTAITVRRGTEVSSVEIPRRGAGKTKYREVGRLSGDLLACQRLSQLTFRGPVTVTGSDGKVVASGEIEDDRSAATSLRLILSGGARFAMATTQTIDGKPVKLVHVPDARGRYPVRVTLGKDRKVVEAIR